MTADPSHDYTSRLDALIALVASGIVVGASLYFVNPAWAAVVDSAKASALALLP